MTDAEFLDDMKRLAVDNTIVFVTVAQLDRLRTLSNRLPVVVIAKDGMYALQSNALAELVRQGHNTLALRVRRQLLK